MTGELPTGDNEQQENVPGSEHQRPDLPPGVPSPPSVQSPSPLQHPRYLPPGQTPGQLQTPPPPQHHSVPSAPQAAFPSQAPQVGAVAPPRCHGEILVDGRRWEPAGCWRRLGAFLLDFVVLSVLWQVLLVLLDIPEPDLTEYWPLMGRMFDEITLTGMPSNETMDALNAFSDPARFATWLKVLMCASYFTVFHGMLGATLGKVVLGLRVMRRTGQRLGYGRAFLRYVGYWLLAKLAYTGWLIPLNREQRTLYDMVLSTNVFKVKRDAVLVVQPKGYTPNPPSR